LRGVVKPVGRSTTDGVITRLDSAEKTDGFFLRRTRRAGIPNESNPAVLTRKMTETTGRKPEIEEKRMKNRFLGKIEVSPIGMGCMALSHGYGKVPEEKDSIDAIRAAFDFGCTFFDTAEAYGEKLFYRGHNEQILGKAVEGFRDKVVLATKMSFRGVPYQPGDPVYPILKEHLTKSLENLRTDYVDLYYLHRIHPDMPPEDAAAAFGKLIDEGLIRGWGLSQVSAAQLDAFHKVTPVSAVQNLYNMLERDCEEDIFPYCLSHNIGVVPFSPIASGFLSGKITTDTVFEKVDDVRVFVPQLSKENIAANQPIVDILNRYAGEKGATPAQIALAWMLHKYPNVVPIPGSKHKERILENLGAWNVTLTDQEFAGLETALGRVTVHGHRGHVEDQRSGMKDWKR